MTKSEQRQCQIAQQAAAAVPEYAAATLASLHRSANARTQAEILAIVVSSGLLGWVTMVNGAMVPAEHSLTAQQVAAADSMFGCL